MRANAVAYGIDFASVFFLLDAGHVWGAGMT
jgi:hypothetical protein